MDINEDEILNSILKYVVAKKVIKEEGMYDWKFRCPACTDLVKGTDCYCSKCGQKLIHYQ